MSVGRAWVWIVAAVLVVVAIVVGLALLARGKKEDANRAFADGVEAWASPRIAAKTKQLNVLKADMHAEAVAVKAAEDDVSKARMELEAKFTDLGLPATEVAARMQNLRI